MNWQWQHKWNQSDKLFKLNSKYLVEIRKDLQFLAIITNLQFVEEPNELLGVWQEQLLVLGYDESLQVIKSELSNLSLYRILDKAISDYPNHFPVGSIASLVKKSIDTSAAIERLYFK
jgi:hypothetical protein